MSRVDLNLKRLGKRQKIVVQDVEMVREWQDPLAAYLAAGRSIDFDPIRELRTSHTRFSIGVFFSRSGGTAGRTLKASSSPPDPETTLNKRGRNLPIQHHRNCANTLTYPHFSPQCF